MENVKERVIANLKTFGLDGDIKDVTLKHLIKIDEVLEEMVSAQTIAIQDIKNNKISINRISKESGIARQTFYNNPIIITYIEQYLAIKSVNNPYETIETLKEELRHKNEQIAKMVQRDATISKYKAKNKELTDEIVSLQATIKAQEELICKLRASSKTIKLFN